MRLLRRMRTVGETVVAHAGLAVVPWLPRRAVLGLAWTLGRLAHRLSGRTRRVARANVDLAFGDAYGPERRAAIVREAYRVFALVMLDLFWFARRTEARVARHVRFDEGCEERFFALKPAVSVGGHIGNWEILGQAIALRDPPFLAVAAPLKNEAIDELVSRLRRAGRQRVAYKEGAMREVLRTLRGGGRVGLLLDQNILPEEGGVFVNLFGRPVPMSAAAARLAIRMRCPVTSMICLPEAGGRYRCHAPAPLVPGEGESPEALTQRVALLLETEIRRRPECWLWMYKRWKYAPGDGTLEGFPYYARRLASPARGGQT